MAKESIKELNVYWTYRNAAMSALAKYSADHPVECMADLVHYMENAMQLASDITKERKDE